MPCELFLAHSTMENKPIGPCAKRESLLLSKMSGQRIGDKSTSGSAAVVHWTGRRRGGGVGYPNEAIFAFAHSVINTQSSS